ncbi:MAG: glycine--tRNA ligase [Parcubacteria group bacterium CG08_land_8_20_14_0_20_43_9]|nr:MAG: glycine--tRNA ligase [Parcubacteria group bacterium CG08_land_8_20_14_0_20_43_9]
MDLMQKIISLSKRRGFIFPSSEIYGGFGSSYDFGPLGALLKDNIKKAWLGEMLQKQDNVVGLDAAILMSPKAWEASGHLTAGFADELVECLSCHKRFRVDEIEKDKCPECGGKITKPKQFNLMMKTFVGPVEDESAVAFLRAETCQGIYINFKNVLNSGRLKLPLGIAQIGKSFRNEITTKNFIFRMREFEQMEMQWFCHPKEADKWFEFWKEQRLNWYLDLGVKKENLKLLEIPDGQRAHYAKRQIDLEYNFPFGWQEIEGIHNRGDWDLSQHQKHSGQDLSYKDPDTGEEYIPHIIETSVGVERSLLAFFIEAYQEIKGGRTETTEATKEEETVLKLDKKLAPIKVAVLPLVKNKKEITKKAQEIYKMIKPHFMAQYDEAGSIGRRYRRQDEIGTLYCITVDFDTLDDDDVTVRDRDTMKQKRVKIGRLLEYLSEKLN